MARGLVSTIRHEKKGAAAGHGGKGEAITPGSISVTSPSAPSNAMTAPPPSSGSGLPIAGGEGSMPPGTGVASGPSHAMGGGGGPAPAAPPAAAPMSKHAQADLIWKSPGKLIQKGCAIGFTLTAGVALGGALYTVDKAKKYVNSWFQH
ncbi:Uncharacterized protein PBTT_01999 [Plasmodiophora brassicae]|uniref:Uncharacterized protein n=1 Tax=Plasmodiophora brassicae TaxID=37360 RepID=A0A3P3Y3L4_PLABS|nr:unnamed protein product [Plasmodiophora brassicae]